MFKVELIDIFYIYQWFKRLCKVKGVAHSDKPTENYPSTPQLLSALSAHCFGFMAHNYFG